MSQPEAELESLESLESKLGVLRTSLERFTVAFSPSTPAYGPVTSNGFLWPAADGSRPRPPAGSSQPSEPFCRSRCSSPWSVHRSCGRFALADQTGSQSG
jgi:hypothetical protein